MDAGTSDTGRRNLRTMSDSRPCEAHFLFACANSQAKCNINDRLYIFITDFVEVVTLRKVFAQYIGAPLPWLRRRRKEFTRSGVIE